MNSYLEAKTGAGRPHGSTASTALVKPRGTTLPASTGIADPYLAFAAQESGQDILGKLMRFSKGDYIADKAEIPRGSEFLAAVDALVVGYQRWTGKTVAERVMGRVSDGFREPDRSELGHEDESIWETDAEGRAQDPWAKTRMLPLKRLSDGELFTLTLTGKGRSGEAIGRLVGAYGRSRHRDTDYPIIRLGVDAYEHRQFGRIKYPILPIVGWRPRHEFAELETGGAAPAVGRGVATEMDDIPDIDVGPEDRIPF
jgi:hypothetical protein